MEGFSQELQSVSELVPKLKIAPLILVFKIVNLDTGYENNFEKLGKVGFGIASVINYA
jgi:hypothetical protein